VVTSFFVTKHLLIRMITLRMRSLQHVVNEKNCTFKTKGKAEFAKPRFRWTDNMIMY